MGSQILSLVYDLHLTYYGILQIKTKFQTESILKMEMHHIFQVYLTLP